MADFDDEEEVITTATLPHIAGTGIQPNVSFTSAGCNRDPNCTAWITLDASDTNGYIIYGAGRLVCIYDVAAACVTATLRGHKHRVNAVAVIKDDNRQEKEILTGSTDHHILHWRYNIATHTYKLIQIITDHTECITALSVVTTSHGHQLISTSTDGTVRVYTRSSPTHEWICTQTLDTGRSRIMACITPHVWKVNEKEVIIMAVGGVDCKIHLYMSTVAGQYEPLLSLEGHEDWLRCVTFCTTDTGSLMLASSSQDRRIRLWAIDIRHADNDMRIQDGSTTSFGSRGYVAHWHGIDITVILDAVLTGHEDWVLAVRWHPPILRNGKHHQPLSLLSSSTDKTMMIWRPDEITAIYTPYVRVGEVGGHTLGFYGCQFGPDGRRILANGYSGCFHLWEQPDEKVPTSWIPGVTVSGHAAAVMDCTWDRDENYLLTTSLDQTTRVMAPWKEQLKGRPDISHPRWYEVARPQIHGYDLNCITCIPGSISHRFASGADEKIVRIFLAPEPFIASLQTFANITTIQDDTKRAVRSTLPELGLSNKGLTKETKKHTYKDLVTAVPPDEDHLINTTLWPEVEKLYGHGYEVICVTCNHRGTLLASACVSKRAKFAVIRVWETKEWTEIAQLESHQLTVVQLEFSHDDRYLLSVSRDRHLSVFSINESATPIWSLQARIKAHARIIWSCSWTHDDAFFATGARDKKVKIWRQAQPHEDEKKTSPWIQDSSLPDFTSAVTAVAFSPAVPDRYVLAVGFEDGRIELYAAPMMKSNLQWACISQFDTDICHALTVRRLRWRIHKTLDQHTSKSADFDLASCSVDTSVRLFHVDLNA